jgi:aminopeptidase N
MSSFVEQPGVPIVSAELRCDGKPRVRLSQRRFFNAADRPSDATWRVPVCMKWDGGRTCALLDAPSKEVALPSCPTWLMLNEDAAGYYHSRYDAPSLAALRGAFATALTVRERERVALDVRAAVEQGSLPLAAALDLLPVLLADDDLRVFRRGVSLLNLLNPRELTDAQEVAYGRALVKLLGARARTVGWTPKEGEDPAMASVRPLLLGMLASRAHDREIIAEARKQADRWLRDRTAVAPDMVRPVLEMAALGGDPKLFDRVLVEARKVKDRRERGLLLDTLGGFHAPALSQRALQLVVGSEFDLRESMNALYRALSQRETRLSTWAFLKQHFDAVVAHMRDDEAMWLFGRVPHTFCDATHRSEVEAFLAPRARTHVGAPHALEDALESAKSCEATLARNREAIAAFLAQY